jgi:two-component system CheB/CheR fusion protein
MFFHGPLLAACESGADKNEITFAQVHNLLSEPPLTKLALVSCRNLLIYREAPLHKHLLPMLHYALRPGGFLFLGPSETISDFEHLFATVDRRWKLFRRKDTAGVAPFLRDYRPRIAAQMFANRRMAERGQAPTARQALLLDSLLPARDASPSVIINDRGEESREAARAHGRDHSR